MEGANCSPFELEGVEPQEVVQLTGGATSENDRFHNRGTRAISWGYRWIVTSLCHRRGRRYVIEAIVALSFGIIIYYNQSFVENERVPPLARREEGRVVYAGAPPPRWDNAIPRQSGDSEHPLMDPPIAVEDPYGWMRDESRSDPEVLRHLEDNNQYTRYQTRRLQKTKDALYNEMKSFMLETSHSFPNLDGDFYYYRRTIQGMPYPLHARAPKPSFSGDDGNNIDRFHAEYLKKHLTLWDNSESMPILPNEVVYLDENVVSQGHEYFDVGSIEISPSQELMAYTVDTHGNEFYELLIREIDNENLIFPNNGHQEDAKSPFIISGQLVWGANDNTLFYTKTDEAQRSYQVYCRTFNFSENNSERHDVVVSEERLLFEELDSLYYVGIEKTSDGKYLLIYNDSSESSEVHYVNLSDGSMASNEPSIISNRAQGVLYYVEHFRGFWLILSNRGRDPNFQLFKAEVNGDSEWIRLRHPDIERPLLDGVPIENLSVFQNHIAIEGRTDGLMKLWVVAFDEDCNVVSLEELNWIIEPAYSVDLGFNANFNVSSIIVEYESLVSMIYLFGCCSMAISKVVVFSFHDLLVLQNFFANNCQCPRQPLYNMSKWTFVIPQISALE
jgi:oligopeptidase B